MDRWKAEMGRVREEKRRRKRKSQKKEDPGARKGSEVAIHCVFPMIYGSRGSKSRLAKAAGAEPAGQMRDEKLHAVVARSTFPSQNVQDTPCSDHFWKLRCLKSARRCGAKLWSQNVQNTPGSDHFWKLRCRKSARCCGAKHISKSKRTRHTRFGPLLEAAMSKKCTPLWCEARFEVKMYKTHQDRTTFWKLRCRKSARSCGGEAHFDVKMLKALHVRATFGRSDVASRGRCKGLWTLSKVSKTWGFCSISKNDGRRGTFEENLERCIFPWQAQYKRHVHQSC